MMLKLPAVVVVALASTAASAALLPVIDYSGPNGSHVNYLDNTHPANTGVVNQPLTGGVGDLTDNVASTAFTHATWVGWLSTSGPFSASTPLTTVFEFPNLVQLNEVQIDTANDANAQGSKIRVPAKIVLSFSDDGVTFSDAFETVPAFTPASSVAFEYFTITIPVDGAIAQFVKVESYHESYDTNTWVFYNNLRFDGKLPEPGSAALIGVGALVLARRRRR